MSGTALRVVLLAVGVTFLPSLSIAAAPDALTVCVAPTDANGQVLYATDLGLFAKHNLAVTIQKVSSSLAYSATIGGTCSIGYTNIAVVETAYAKGIPVTLIAPASTSPRGQRAGYLMVRNGVDVSSAKDLEGKVIAQSDLHSVARLATDSWLDQNGADSNKVKYIEIPFPAMTATLQQGRIDAAMMIEPFASAAKPYAKVFGSDPFQSIAGGNILGGGYFAMKDWATAHPDVVARFAQAIKDAGDWANKNQSESAQILSKYTGVPASEIQSYPRALYVDRVDVAMIQPTIDALAKYKLIDARFNATDLIFRPAK